MKTIYISLIFFSLCPFAWGQIYKDKNAKVEDRVENLLQYLTSDEKLQYIGGVDAMYIRDIPRLGLPKIKMSDGPVGVKTWGKTTGYPAGICTAATFDKDLVFSLGEALGRDARARGVHIILGPGVNIYRAPMCGRNFEYFGEDPFLAGKTAAVYVKGIQSMNVAATVKHYAGNNQEWNRYGISSDIDERTLQEIYLTAFRMAVKEGKAWAIMDAYNLLNGIHCTQNSHLNNEILKVQWQFPGIVMSDWGATHDGVAAANGGLDLEMPSGDNMSVTNLSSALVQGKVSQPTIDDKVRRILRLIFNFGFYDNIQTDNSIALDSPENDSVSLNLARNGIVLLKNDSILPFAAAKVKSIAVIGPNADRYVTGGGSSYVDPFHYISAYQGIRSLAPAYVRIRFAGTPPLLSQLTGSVFYSAAGSQTKGLTGFYFNNQTLEGQPVAQRIDTVVDFHWAAAPDVPGMPADNFSIRWTGVIRPQTTGKYSFTVAGDDGFRLTVNNQLLIDNWVDEAVTAKSGTINLIAGQEYPVKLEYYENAGLAEITLGYISSAVLNKLVLDAADSSDVAIVCVGFNSDTEGEGYDRPFDMGADQDSLITMVAGANPNTVVVTNAGGNVDTEAWLGMVKGLVQAWYPGQNGGKALAEILFGKISPSGKLPVTFEKKWSDSPVFSNYYENNGPGHVKYNEGLFVGYRYYDMYHIEPLFPFGFGLSYTTFSYSDLSVTRDLSDSVIVSFSIQNTGNMAGAEAAQVYVSPESPKVQRPVKELKEYAKVYLLPGETKTINVKLDPYAFSYYSPERNGFAVDSGKYDIIIGASSADERLRQSFVYEKNLLIGIEPNEYNPSNKCLIYPVPAKDIIYVTTWFNAASDIDFRVYNSAGMLIDHRKYYDQHITYDCGNLPDGLYFCRVSAGINTLTGKFIIGR
ncbi:MAG TPA: glycoside hydrolase family 3 C-terminal domain-containing protein [Bacteroidales bacterium]|nr:glycoside hydrolase family 3 C-terminal domain-containing protein [Bacteroidales bacterium]